MLKHQSRALSLSRRRLLAGAAVGGAKLAMPWPAFAQDATPAVMSEPITSLTREEYQAQLIEAMQFTEAATPGGTFIDSNTSDIQSMHPFLAEEAVTIGVTSLIYETLVGGDLRTGQPAPNQLADYWEIAPDGKTYTFHLNQNAKWHDGTDFTADDVQFSFDAMANEETGSVYTGSFNDAVESWRVIDEHTFEVVSKEPIFTFIYEIIYATNIVPKHIWENAPFAEWRTDPGATGTDPSRVVGTGPFKFQEWNQGVSVTLVRNDDYYGKVPSIDSYVLNIWPDQTAVINALLNGEMDVASLESADVAAIQGTPGITVAEFPSRGFLFYEFNLDPEVTTKWQDQRVRQAMLYALDRESIANDILLTYAEVAQGTQPVISYAYAPDKVTTQYAYDPEKAKSLLTEAGWTDTDGDGVVDKDGESLSFELLYPGGSSEWDQIAAYVQDAWSEIGVAATPRALEFSALIEATTTNPTFDMAFYRFSWDATFIQDPMFGCDQYQVGFNDMKYCNPELDAINDEAKRTFDEDARRELLIQASNIVNDEQPVGILVFEKGHVAYNDALQNYTVGPWGVDLTYVWIQQ